MTRVTRHLSRLIKGTSRTPPISLFGQIAGRAIAAMFALGVLGLSTTAIAMPPRENVSREHPEKIDPWLQTTLGLNGASEMLVLLDGSADLSPADGLPGRAQKGQFVYDALRGAAMQSQAPVIAWLKAKGYEVTPFWIVNAILVKGDLALAREITALPGVHRVVGNPVVHALEDYSEGGSSSEVQPLPAGRHLAAASAARLRDPRSAVSGDPDRSSDGEDPGLISYAAATNTIVCGVVLIHANTVWTSKGVRGEGIVIANMDTGVDWTHPTLQTHYRGWNAGSPDHTYSWHDAIDHTTVPFDDGYHGTHTAGILVGDDGAGNQIGVAPGAKWIACRNMDHGDGTPARYLECMQWGLAPYPQGANPFTAGRPDLGADITNNSWGCPPTEGCDPLTLQQGFDNLRAAGQMTVVSAGNAGFSGCATVKDPPSLYDSVFTQGSVTCGGDLSSFSSRGPVTIDGSNRLKPNTVAPGTSILSAEPGGGYQTLSGTSMASPHTAGAMALLWSAKPNLKRLIRISRCYMEQSAGTVTGSSATCGGIPPSTRPNNLWGWGLINALAAIDLGPDTDSDGIADACDCAAGNGGAFEAPPEVGGDVFSNNKITATWQPLSALAGTGTQYDVVRGLVSNLRLAQDFSGAACFSENHAVANISDPQLPPVGDVFYYLERGQNTCGTGTYGNGKEGNPRNITACN